MRVCFRYGRLLPSLQARQFSAAAGLSRLLIILGAIEPPLRGENASEEVIQRQVGENTHTVKKVTPNDVTLMVRQQDGSETDSPSFLSRRHKVALSRV